MTAEVAVPSESTSPKRAMPEMRIRRAGPWPDTFTESPTAQPCFSALPASTTTSSAPRANRPWRSWNGVRSPAPLAPAS